MKSLITSNRFFSVVIILGLLVFFYLRFDRTIIADYRNAASDPVGQMINGKKEGEWKTYYQSSKQILTIEHYSKGKLNGLAQTYDRDGRLTLEANYHLGTMVETFTQYGKGRIVFSTHFDSLGRSDGKFELFYPNGQLKQTGMSTHGIDTGEWLTFDESGNITSRIKK